MSTISYTTESLATDDDVEVFVPATEKQIRFMSSLLNRKKLSERLTQLVEAAIRVGKTGYLRRSQASEFIDAMLKADDKPRKASTAPEGMHMLDGVVYKVQRSQRGFLYAKELNPSWKKFTYAAGAVAKLSAETLMSEEDAAQYGHRYGICACCGRILTNAESIDAGIGPVCRARLQAVLV